MNQIKYQIYHTYNEEIIQIKTLNYHNIQIDNIKYKIDNIKYKIDNIK